MFPLCSTEFFYFSVFHKEKSKKPGQLYYFVKKAVSPDVEIDGLDLCIKSNL